MTISILEAPPKDLSYSRINLRYLACASLSRNSYPTLDNPQVRVNLANHNHETNAGAHMDNNIWSSDFLALGDKCLKCLGYRPKALPITALHYESLKLLFFKYGRIREYYTMLNS
jgi:hypothetical protein